MNSFTSSRRGFRLRKGHVLSPWEVCDPRLLTSRDKISLSVVYPTRKSHSRESIPRFLLCRVCSTDLPRSVLRNLTSSVFSSTAKVRKITSSGLTLVLGQTSAQNKPEVNFFTESTIVETLSSKFYRSKRTFEPYRPV